MIDHGSVSSSDEPEAVPLGGYDGVASGGGAAVPVLSLIPQSDRNDGPTGWSHSVWTGEEVAILVQGQVAGDGAGLDQDGYPLLVRLSGSASDQVWASVRSRRGVIDWRVTAKVYLGAATTIRAALGQLIGHEAPVGESCTACRKTNGPFRSCCIVFLTGLGF